MFSVLTRKENNENEQKTRGILVHYKNQLQAELATTQQVNGG